MKIFATEQKTGVEIEIEDLFWFEEEGVHQFSDGRSSVTSYVWKFRFVVEEGDLVALTYVKTPYDAKPKKYR